MRQHLLTATLAAALVLAACSQPQPPSEPEPEFPVTGTIANLSDVPMPTFASFAALHPVIYAVTSTDLEPQGKDYEGRVFAFDSTPLGADGSFEWDLGDPPDIPAGYLTFADQAFHPIDESMTCDLTASGSVQVLRSLVQDSIMTPVGLLGPLSLSNGYVDGLLVYTDASDLVETPTEPYRIGTWLWAEDAVNIQGECVYDDGVDPPYTAIEIDVALAAGWTPLVLLADPVARTATIGNGTFDGAWLAVVYPAM